MNACLQVDILLAPSAGNSVRRCVSVGSRTFVGSPHHTAVNPATIQDCRVDSWTGPSAIYYNLRGPLTLLDNDFTNGTGTVSMPTVVVDPWPQTNAVVLAAGNTIDGKAASMSSLMPKPPKNVFVYDLADTSGVPRTGITASTTFLKSWWPGVPTKFIEAAAHGCTGKATDDATTCAQATVDAAAAAGNGAAAYFAPGTYRLTKPLTVEAGNYTVLGGGVKTQFSWAGETSADPAVLLVRSTLGHVGLQMRIQLLLACLCFQCGFLCVWLLLFFMLLDFFFI